VGHSENVFGADANVVVLIEFGPLIFGTAGLLAILLFFSVEQH
jgi:hypothetical protein